MRVACIAAILLAASSSFAEERKLPANVEIRFPSSGETLVLRETHFLIERATIDKANATAKVNEELAADLKKCADEKRKLSPEDPPAWVTAAKWSGLGIAVGLAFTAGVLVAR